MTLDQAPPAHAGGATLRHRAQAAATATERLVATLVGATKEECDDPVVAAYLRRLLHAAGRAEDEGRYVLDNIQAADQYLGPLRRGMGTTAERHA